MGLGTDILGLSETGWAVNSANRFLLKGAAAIAVGAGRVDVSFNTDGKTVGLSGTGVGLGVGAGGAFSFGRELTRAILKYASVLKFLSAKSDLYRYAVTNNEAPSVDKLLGCDLVLTTLSGNAVMFGGSLDYYAFYRKGEPNIPRWVWFSAGAEVTGGGSGSLMQYKFDTLTSVTA